MVGMSREIVIAGDIFFEVTQDIINTVHRSFLTCTIFIYKPQWQKNERRASVSPLTNDMEPSDNGSATYIFENFAYNALITDLETLKTTPVK